MPKTHVLRVGDKLQVNGELTIIKCGMRSEGGDLPVPTVTVEVDGEEAAVTEEPQLESPPEPPPTDPTAKE